MYKTFPDIDVVVVDSAEKMNEFIRLPWRIYEFDPNWVPPLMDDMWGKLDKRSNLFFRRAEVVNFICFSRGKAVGRVSGIEDRKHNDYYGQRTAIFGLFESINDQRVAVSLLNAVEIWAKDRGLERLIGPLSLNIDEEVGMLVEGNHHKPSFLMPYHPSYYSRLMGLCGFSKLKDLFAYSRDVSRDGYDKIKRICRIRPIKSDIIIRPIERRRLNEEMKKVARLYNSSFDSHWGALPLSDEEVESIAASLKKYIVPELFYVAEVDGKFVAVVAALPNYNEVLEKLNGRLGMLGSIKYLYHKGRIGSVRIFLFGADSEYKGSNLEAHVFIKLAESVNRMGFRQCELSWVLEDNVSANNYINASGARVTKKYRVYQKALDGAQIRSNRVDDAVPGFGIARSRNDRNLRRDDGQGFVPRGGASSVASRPT